MLANFVVNLLNTSLFTKLLLLLTSQILRGPKSLLDSQPKIWGPVTLVSTGSGPHEPKNCQNNRKLNRNLK